jgi:hypothetical protein
MMAEEARANIRGFKYAKGARMRFAKTMLPAYGGYLTGGLAIAAATGLGIEALRRALKSKNKKVEPLKTGGGKRT